LYRLKVKQLKLRQLSFGPGDLLVRQRTQIINALRGHLAEFGLVVPTGPAHVGRLLAEAEDYARSLPQAVRPILGVLIEALHSLDEKIAVLDAEISRRAKEDEDARRLKTIPGIGPVTAAAISALAPPAQTFGEGAISPPGWGSRRCSGPPAASRSLAGPQKGASAQYAAY
jgi:transposase